MKTERTKAKPRTKKKTATTTSRPAAKSATRLRIPELAQLLSRAVGRPIPTHVIEDAIRDGAPVNLDGTCSLIELAAWLETQRTR